MPELYNELSFVVDLDKPIITTKMYNLFVTTSKEAHKVILTLRRGGQNVNFTGDVTATLITRADMVTQDADGKAEDGKVTFTFPESFYVQPGIFDLIIFVDDQDSHVPVFCGEGNMIVGQTDLLYDPNNVVPSLAELLAQIENVRDAASSANSAASSANSAASFANSAANTANTATNNANAATTEANNAANKANTAASNANVATTNANNAAGAANQAAGRAENVASKSPYIGSNGNWYVYDVTAGAYVDSGSSAQGTGDVSSVNGVTPDINGNVTVKQPSNLIDNSNFQINQREKTTYTGENIYTVDRWRTTQNSTIKVVEDGITFSPNAGNEFAFFDQFIEYEKFKIGQTYTMAISADGEICCGSFVYNGETSGSVPLYRSEATGLQTAVYYLQTYVACRIRSAAVGTTYTINWAALYEGEYTAETLPPYVPKDYMVELLECRRYYRKFEYVDSNLTIAVGISLSSNSYFPVYIGDMRIKPTMEWNALGITNSSFSGANVTDAFVYGYDKNSGLITIRATSNVTETTKAYRLGILEGGYMIFNADL